MTSSISNTQTRWFNALHFAAPFLRGAVRVVASDTEVLPGDPSSPWIGRWEVVKPAGFGAPATLRLWINIDLDLPAIESTEMHLTLVSLAYWKLQYGTFGDDSTARHDLCQKLGCWPEVLNVPATRWRLLQASRSLADLPFIALEDRRTCVICPGRIATGASAADEYPDEPGANRFDIHGACWKYLHHVLAPQIRAARAKRKEEGE